MKNKDKLIEANNGLVFKFNEGTISIQIDCTEWYLETDVDNKIKKEYLSPEWFYDKLNNNLDSICMFAAIFTYNCNFKDGQDLIAKYEQEMDDFIGDGNMDTCIYAMEVFAQRATNCNNLHWW